jgi:hypothetical protein
MLCAAALTASLTGITIAGEADPAANRQKPRCAGKVATIVGTKRGERIVGTNKRDVIVARGGHDRIFGLGGNDIICAGLGNDRVVGGPGVDFIYGQPGRDRLYGGPGPDVLAGQLDNDTLNGGSGIDTCFQGPGTGPVVRCERPVPPPPPAPLPPPKVLAIAYTEVDGVPGYGAGDVMISRLLDTSRDGAPGAGDTVEMGGYPLDWDADGFGDWKVDRHDVTSLRWIFGTEQIRVNTPAGIVSWANLPGEAEWYCETRGEMSSQSCIQDGWSAGPPLAYGDSLHLRSDSPSQPATPVDDGRTHYGDDKFLDVAMYP